MSNENDVSIKINNESIHGWTRTTIIRDMEKLSSSFELQFKLDFELMDHLSGQDFIELYIGQDKILTGYIYKLKPSISDKGDVINVIGRDKAGDLVDCSAVNNPGVWRKLNLERIVTLLCEPFGIFVRARAEMGDNFEQFSIDTGESVFEAIMRACKERAVIPIVDEEGNIQLESTSDIVSNDTLVYGQNVVRGTGDTDYANRFSEIVIKSQSTSVKDGWGKRDISVFAKATDQGVTRYRPLQIKADNQMSNKIAQQRANWEVQVRGANSQKSQLTVKGWRQTDGTLWNRNRLVNTDIPLLNLRTTMLISGVTMQHDKSGKHSVITVVGPGAYEPEPKKQYVPKDKTGWTLR